MIEILFLALLFGTLIVAVTSIILSRDGYLTIPFLAAIIFIIWFLPQAWTVISSGMLVPEIGQTLLLLLALLSFGAVISGWKSSRASVRVPALNSRLGETTPLASALAQMNTSLLRLLVTIFVGFGVAVQILIQLQPADALLARQPSGLITILKFFSTVNPIALFLSFAYFLSRRSAISLILFGFALTIYAPAILLSIKRAEIIEFFITLAFCLWAVRGFAIRRKLLTVFVLPGLVVLLGVSELRSMGGYTLSDSGAIERQLPSISDLMQVDWLLVIKNGFGSIPHEYLNGVYFIQEVWTTGYIGLGRGLSNAMVTMWLPGQFIGADLKQSMYFNTPGLDEALERFNLTWQTGTTSTGFPEIYSDWAIFGFVLFFYMGRRTGRAFRAGLNGDLAHAATYPAMVPLVLLSFTHGGYLFFQIFPLILAFFFVIRFITKRSKTPRESPTRMVGS